MGSGRVEHRLPTGTVTLLLADVEGSTLLWERDSSAARPAMAQLDALADELIASFGGVRPVEQGEGDSFVAAFARASDAVACAIELQRRLLDSPLRVRMGLHTGEIDVRDDSRYDGPTIIRAARIRDLGHGGQVLLSGATRDMVLDALPDGADTIDLGPYPLKGIDRPERVFQLTHPDLEREFPPLRTGGSRRSNLPVQLTSLIGRTAEIDDVTKLLEDHRLVTLMGAGGCGKTRLAIEVASRVSAAPEQQVVELVAEGLTNKQVAERLIMSPRTVSTHLSHVFAKLGVSSRSELTAASAKRP